MDFPLDAPEEKTSNSDGKVSLDTQEELSDTDTDDFSDIEDVKKVDVMLGMIEYHPKLDHDKQQIPGILELGILGNIEKACGRGFGRALMELLEYDAVRRQCYTLSLQTHVYNVGAQKFYKHMKFVQTKSEIPIEKEANAKFCKAGDHAIFEFYKQM